MKDLTENELQLIRIVAKFAWKESQTRFANEAIVVHPLSSDEHFNRWFAECADIKN